MARSAYGFQFRTLPLDQDFCKSATDRQTEYLRDLCYQLGVEPRTVLTNVGRAVNLRQDRVETKGGVSMVLTFLKEAGAESVRMAVSE